MVKKKAYILPDTTVIVIEGSNLMITASGGGGDIHLTYDDVEGNAYDGLSRKSVFDDDEDDSGSDFKYDYWHPLQKGCKNYELKKDVS